MVNLTEVSNHMGAIKIAAHRSSPSLLDNRIDNLRTQIQRTLVSANHILHFTSPNRRTAPKPIIVSIDMHLRHLLTAHACKELIRGINSCRKIAISVPLRRLDGLATHTES